MTCLIIQVEFTGVFHVFLCFVICVHSWPLEQLATGFVHAVAWGLSSAYFYPELCVVLIRLPTRCARRQIVARAFASLIHHEFTRFCKEDHHSQKRLWLWACCFAHNCLSSKEPRGADVLCHFCSRKWWKVAYNLESKVVKQAKQGSCALW